ncbi:hypothetical protein D3C73_599390 [compost metagenome]
MFEHHIVRIGIQQDKICACIFYLFPAQLQVNEFHPVHAPVFIVPVNPRRLDPSPVEADIAKGHFFDPRTRFRVVILVFHHPQIKQLSLLDPFNPDIARLNQMDPRPIRLRCPSLQGIGKKGQIPEPAAVNLHRELLRPVQFEADCAPVVAAVY